jgi:hypothetical protein
MVIIPKLVLNDNIDYVRIHAMSHTSDEEEPEPDPEPTPEPTHVEPEGGEN